ncbi:hypothetical protein BDK51DRAFT_41215 [Blyttiomyces helicus]|uniref:Uncharacterized protein n=1 Tax=Blyttiomyces helicus TaxID=388810 RepID=A0A4P9WRH6_9FUNG|nr:hypothetical protein BDK51DRAFT_41215 [Blyttiomyces helicus]|eukprot:RKO94793.1 hypothetical protein BDK51DRAFT_41215 [Blyttiomyces helicus]
MVEPRPPQTPPMRGNNPRSKRAQTPTQSALNSEAAEAFDSIRDTYRDFFEDVKDLDIPTNEAPLRRTQSLLDVEGALPAPPSSILTSPAGRPLQRPKRGLAGSTSMGSLASLARPPSRGGSMQDVRSRAASPDLAHILDKVERSIERSLGRAQEHLEVSADNIMKARLASMTGSVAMLHEGGSGGVNGVGGGAELGGGGGAAAGRHDGRPTGLGSTNSLGSRTNLLGGSRPNLGGSTSHLSGGAQALSVRSIGGSRNNLAGSSSNLAPRRAPGGSTTALPAIDASLPPSSASTVGWLPEIEPRFRSDRGRPPPPAPGGSANGAANVIDPKSLLRLSWQERGQAAKSSAQAALLAGEERRKRLKGTLGGSLTDISVSSILEGYFGLGSHYVVRLITIFRWFQELAGELVGISKQPRERKVIHLGPRRDDATFGPSQLPPGIQSKVRSDPQASGDVAGAEIGVGGSGNGSYFARFPTGYRPPEEQDKEWRAQNKPKIEVRLGGEGVGRQLLQRLRAFSTDLQVRVDGIAVWPISTGIECGPEQEQPAGVGVFGEFAG